MVHFSILAQAQDSKTPVHFSVLAPLQFLNLAQVNVFISAQAQTFLKSAQVHFLISAQAQKF